MFSRTSRPLQNAGLLADVGDPVVSHYMEIMPTTTGAESELSKNVPAPVSSVRSSIPSSFVSSLDTFPAPALARGPMTVDTDPFAGHPSHVSLASPSVTSAHATATPVSWVPVCACSTCGSNGPTVLSPEPDDQLDALTSDEVDEIISSLGDSSPYHYPSPDRSEYDEMLFGSARVEPKIKLEPLSSETVPIVPTVVAASHAGIPLRSTASSAASAVYSGSSAWADAHVPGLADEQDARVQLGLAVQARNFVALKELVAVEGTVNITDSRGQTGLHMVAICPTDMLIVDLLLAAGGDPNMPDHESTTPLMYACRGGHVQVVSRLLRAGGSTACVDLARMTPLMMASSGHHVDVVQLLLQHTDPLVNAQDVTGRTALLWAVAVRAHSCVQTLLAAKLIDVCAIDHRSECTLHIAVRNGDLEVCSLVLVCVVGRDQFQHEKCIS